MFQLNDTSRTKARAMGVPPFIPPAIPSAYMRKWPIRLNRACPQAQLNALVSLRAESWRGPDIALLITGGVYLMCDGWNGSARWLSAEGAHLSMSGGLHYAQFIDSDNNNYEAYFNCIAADDESWSDGIEAVESAVFQVPQLAPLPPLYPLHMKPAEI